MVTSKIADTDLRPADLRALIPMSLSAGNVLGEKSSGLRYLAEDCSELGAASDLPDCLRVYYAELGQSLARILAPNERPRN